MKLRLLFLALALLFLVGCLAPPEHIKNLINNGHTALHFYVDNTKPKTTDGEEKVRAIGVELKRSADILKEWANGR